MSMLKTDYQKVSEEIKAICDSCKHKQICKYMDSVKDYLIKDELERRKNPMLILIRDNKTCTKYEGSEGFGSEA